MATLLERLAFLQNVPTLMKATADDETPCPGYLFEEISKISHESVGCSQCLLEYLLERLQVESCHVKLKVLKILLHLCGHSPPHFITELRRNVTFIQEVTVYSGPADPVHGHGLFQKVRLLAQELANVLFNDMMSPDSGISASRAATTATGIGSDRLRSGMQGFGCSSGKQQSSGVTLLDKIQKAAEVVASAVLPPAEQAGIRLHDNNYKAVLAPSGTVEVAVPASAYNMNSYGLKASHRYPGQVSGGWEETSSEHMSSHNSTLENEPFIHLSTKGNSQSETGSRSGASRGSGDSGSERVEAMQMGDCGQEMVLIGNLTSGSKIFLSRDESQLFIKECSTLNCEVVVELLCHKLKDTSQTVQMRALCGLACLMCTDYLSLEQLFSITHVHLTQLNDRTTGAVQNKATKLLRQFEALLEMPKSQTQCNNTVSAESTIPKHSGQHSPSTLTSPLLPTPHDSTAPPSTAGQEEQVQLHNDSALLECEAVVLESLQQKPTIVENKDVSTSMYDSTEFSGSRSTQSLFAGMELINRGKPVCLVGPVSVESNTQTDEENYLPSDGAVKNKVAKSSLSVHNQHEYSSEQVSAFSFLNL